jgi:hypothetical protein
MLYDQLHALVPRYLYEASGKIFYSGRSAFAANSKFYLLGFNPGGDPIEQKDDTIGKNIRYALDGREENWSAYVDERWTSQEIGESLMQRNVRYLCKKLGVDPKQVPASNLIFERTRRESFLIGDRKQLIKDCWPVHQAVIDNLMVRILICFGKSTGDHVRKVIGANELIDTFIEKNDRRWPSHVHKSSDGKFVVTLTHPGVAYWTVTASDPTRMIGGLVKS